MKRNILLILFLIGLRTAMGQTPGIISSVRYGGSGAERFTHIIRLNNGNYVCSGFTASADGQAAGNHGGADFFIVCISGQGQLLWKKLIGGSADDGAAYAGNDQLLSPTDDGGFYFGGATSSSNGDIPLLKGSWDIFIARCDQNGNILWKKTYGGTGTELISGLQTTPDGGCIFSATTGSDNNGDVPANHGTNTDVWIVKLNSTGVIEWSKTYGGTNAETAMSLKLTNDGGYIFTADATSEDGDLTGTVPVGAFRRTDIWIVKINSTGAITWMKRIGGSDSDDGAKIISSSTGDFYVLANSRSSDGDFISNTGLYDMALIKLSSSGAVTFIKTLGGLAWDSGNDLIESDDGNIIMAGITYSSQINGITIPARGNSDGILIKADKSNGNIQWISSLGGTQGDFINSLYKSPGGEILLVGETNSADGDFPGPGLGDYDAFILKLAPFNAIKGYVFFDYNGNGIKDGTEPFVQNINVTSTKNNSYSVSGYTDNGNYGNEVDSGTFVTRPRIFNHDYYTIIPDSFVTTFPAYYGAATGNFGLKPIPGKRDLRSTLVALNPARAGFTSYYQLICYNAGTDTVTTGTVKFLKDPRTTFISSVPVQSSISGDTIQWQYNNFKPLDTLVFNITLALANRPVIQIGDWVTYRSVIGPVTGDLVPGDNTFTLYHKVTGAYDPNEKNESHGGIYSSGDLGLKDFLNYTIRFQNTGTDTAFNVVIMDTLDSKLDWKSFDLLATSHKGHLVISDNICKWKFSNINLPDSNRNEPASHGFITYRIKPSSNAHTGDTIRNTASIYFDYNDPVKTNTDLTFIGNLIPDQPQISPVPIYYCSNQPPQKIRLVNIPGVDYHAAVSAKIDDAPLSINADSTVTIDPALIVAGIHALSITYRTATDSSSIGQNFKIIQSVTPHVGLASNITVVTNLQDPVILTASNIAGGGTTPTYVFAKDRNFTTIVQAESQQNSLTLQPSSLAIGNNLFYVSMRTSESCYTVNTGVDSFNITRSTVTAIIDPANPGAVITISPNPFTDELVIKDIDPARTIVLRIYDAVGRKVLDKATIGQTSVTLRPHIRTGIHYLVLYNDKNRKIGSIKLLKK